MCFQSGRLDSKLAIASGFGLKVQISLPQYAVFASDTCVKAAQQQKIHKTKCSDTVSINHVQLVIACNQLCTLQTIVVAIQPWLATNGYTID